MIYELRTIDVRPHAVPEVERHLETTLAMHEGSSSLVGSFHTEIGPLNQIVQLSRFDSDEERERNQFDSTAEIGDLVVDERSDVFVPFAISPNIEAGSPGPFYEIRTYRYAPGDLPKIVGAWEAALPGRLELSPLVFVGSSEAGAINKLLHIWPYRSLDERWELRKRIREAGLWPPLAVARKRGLPSYDLLHMENKIVVPSAYSPLQ
jgi:hypothetical protein